MATTARDFQGSIDGLSFYKRGTKTIVRKKGGPTKEQIKHKASCQVIRNNNREFGGASSVCRELRRKIGHKVSTYSDMDMIGRLTASLKNIITKGKGAQGARVLDIAAHADMLEGFEFNKDCSFGSRFKNEICIEWSEDRNTAVLHTAFRPAMDIVAPAGADSFQLAYTFMRVPAYGVHETKGCYVPLHEAELESSQVASDLIYTSFDMRIKLSLPLTLPESAADGTALLCIVGIAFYNGAVRMGKEVCGMRVVRVG